MASKFVPTVTNMVAIVRNIIQGYRMGPIRALAQEPVQNSKDAARGKVEVEYQLHNRKSADGTENFMLTVTDRNTSGLDGPILSFEDIQNRGNVLGKGDNWAAFEGMGYTKEDESALGSRGQGKAAFLYHSRLPIVDSFHQDRMMILYDTLLSDNTYRLGVRYANPIDSVQSPPFSGEQARLTVSSRYISADGTEIELGLPPLTTVGTRIVVPHLSQEAVEAIHSGELYQWLQRCWWRAIQTGLSINIVDEKGNIRSLTVPEWWHSEPWKKPGQTVKVYRDIDVGDDLRIKRIVLLYDATLNEPDLEGSPHQFYGVQLLRGQQWIETLGSELSDYIPREKRPGFRGFVEFDRRTDRVLRRAENSQHEGFDRRVSGVKTLILAIENRVEEFSKEQGWIIQESTRPSTGVERTAALEFLRFLSPNARRDSQNDKASLESAQLAMDLLETDRWKCDLHLEFPDPDSSRIDWGQSLRNVEVEVSLEPRRAEQTAVSLELSYPADKATAVLIDSQALELKEGGGVAQFGEYQVISGRPSPNKLRCALSGKYRLTARVEAHGVQVARSSRTFYVKEDPPQHSSKPYTVSISVENHTTPQRRINNGDTVGVQISVTNRTSHAENLALTASVGDLLLADSLTVQTDGTPPGASPVRVAGVQAQLLVNPANPTTQLSVDLPPGKHELRADLYLADEVVAHARHTLYVEVDPVQPDNWPPFRIEQITGEGYFPRWQFYKKSQDDWTLQYPPTYPLYRALDSSPSRSGLLLSGVSAFVVDVCAEAIIEWAMQPIDVGDSTCLDELLNGVPLGVNIDRWEDYREKMLEIANLRQSREQVDKYGQLVRECAAMSLSLFEERG